MFCDDALDDEAIEEEDAIAEEDAIEEEDASVDEVALLEDIATDEIIDETSLVVTPPDDEAWMLDVTAVDVLD